MNIKKSLVLACLILGIVAYLATANIAVAAKSQPEDFLETTRASSALEILAHYEHSQMMLMYVELAQRGVTIETPEGRLSKRKANKLAKQHTARYQALDQVMRERGVRELAGKYDWAIEGECESAKAWWPAMGQNGMCGHPSITQGGMDLKIIHTCSHEGQEHELTQEGRTLDDAVIVVEELNSDFVYLGQIMDGSIHFRVNAERALANWPSFEKAPSREALSGCTFVLTPRPQNED